MALIQKLSAGAWFAAAIALAVSSATSAQENNAQKQAETSQAQKSEQGPASAPPVITQTVDSDWRKPACDEPKSHGEADLCEQRRMAKAAEDSVFLNRIQIAVGFITIIGLAFTVYYTRKTADAAILAANAAKEAAEHVPKVERAYIYGGFGHREYGFADDSSWLIHAQPTMANYGRTPGFIRRIELGAGRIDTLPAEPVYPHIIPVQDLFFPEMKMQDVRGIGARIQIPADGHHAVFVRVFFTDVLNPTQEHFTGTIYRLFLGEDNEGNIRIFDEPILPGSAYWAWDEQGNN